MTPKQRRGLRALNHAFEHIRARMEADTLNGVPPNGEALAGSVLVTVMLAVATNRPPAFTQEVRRVLAL